MEALELVALEHVAQLPDSIPDSVENVGGKVSVSQCCMLLLLWTHVRLAPHSQP